MWNPFRSKLAAAIIGGVENIYIRPGSKVLYLGAASGTTVSHVADIVGKVGEEGKEGGRVDKIVRLNACSSSFPHRTAWSTRWSSPTARAAISSTWWVI